MKRVLKYYLSVLFVVVGMLCPAVLLTADFSSEDGGSIACIIVLLGGGGFIYAIGSLYFESYSDKWTNKQETRTMPLLAVISSGVALLLNIIILLCYEDASLFAIYNFVVDFDGSIAEFYLRFLSIIATGISVFPLYCIATGEVDTTIYEWEITTYAGGVEINKEYDSYSYAESKASWFFITLFVACAGVMATSLPVVLIILALNLSAFFNNVKWKRASLILAVLAAIVITVISIVNVLTLGDVTGTDLTIGVAVELLPFVFAGLTTLFFKGYFKYEWMGTVLALILGVFYMIFASWLVSFGLGAGIVGIVSLF